MSDPREGTPGLETDEGVPVGDADVQADVDRASGAAPTEPSTEEYLQRGQEQMVGDDGESVGAADVQADRDNAAEDDA